MNFHSIENYITQFPIYQYTFLSIDDIDSMTKYAPSVRGNVQDMENPGHVHRSRNCGQMQRTMPTVHTCPFIFFCGRSAGLFQYGCSACYQTGA